MPPSGQDSHPHCPFFPFPLYTYIHIYTSNPSLRDSLPSPPKKSPSAWPGLLPHKYRNSASPESASRPSSSTYLSFFQSFSRERRKKKAEKGGDNNSRGREGDAQCCSVLVLLLHAQTSSSSERSEGIGGGELERRGSGGDRQKRRRRR